jgi:hypothetical protein
MNTIKNMLIILLLVLISACTETRVVNKRTPKPKIRYAIMTDAIGNKHPIRILKNDSIKIVYQDVNGVIMHRKK